LAVLAVILPSLLSAQDDPEWVATDGEFGITREEFEYILRFAPPNVRSSVRNNDEDRYEIIVSTLVAKKVLANVESLNVADSPELYYRFEARKRAVARELDAARFQDELRVPDLEEVARERYRVSKNEIARAPEQREVSHILLLCSEECDEVEKRQELDAIREELLAGASFSDLALEHSQDPGSRRNAGRLSLPVTRTDANIDEGFREGVFSLNEVGDLSGIIETAFGFHIVRLETVTPERLYTFAEIKEPLIAEVEKRFREDAYRDYLLSLGTSGDLKIDYEALDAILGTDNGLKDDAGSEPVETE
jgi:peptidyl-prolyl cis-trans isomerase C